MAAESQTAFISYSREDSEFALKLAGDLKAAGAVVWLDQLDIAPGARWARAVEEALAACPRLLVILSPSSAGSTNVDDEVSFALEEKKAVIPVLYRDCKIPFRLRPFQFVDFRSDYALGLKALLRALPAAKEPRQDAGVPQEISATVSNESPAEPLIQERELAVEKAVQEQERPRSLTVQVEGPASGWSLPTIEPESTEEHAQPTEQALTERKEAVSLPEEIQAVDEVAVQSQKAVEPRTDDRESLPQAVPDPTDQKAGEPSSEIVCEESGQDERRIVESGSQPIPGNTVTHTDERGEVSHSKARWISGFPHWARVAMPLCVVLIAALTWYWISLATRSWKPQKSGTGEYLNSVFFTTDLSGWVVGSSGVILHTKDAGKTWDPQTSGTGERLRSVMFRTRESGWIVGDDGVILHTEDGRTWKLQTSGTGENLLSVAFITPQSGWAVGIGGTILHTEDGGNSWKAQKSGVRGWLWSVSFPTPQSGWVVGDDGVILHTEDGGSTWKAQNSSISGDTARLMSVFFTTAQSGRIVGPSDFILRTDDGGATWAQQKANVGGLNSITFLTPTLGWIVGYGGQIYRSRDGGGSWIELESGTHVGLNSVAFTTAQLGWAVGDNGIILHTEDGGGIVK